MFAVQLAFLAVGVVAGPILALWLRRQIRTRPAGVAQRTRMMTAFGIGAAMWVVWAAFSLSGEFALLFLGTVAAIYLPALIVIATTPVGAPSENAAPRV